MEKFKTIRKEIYSELRGMPENQNTFKNQTTHVNNNNSYQIF
jgi:hypothetical protein